MSVLLEELHEIWMDDDRGLVRQRKNCSGNPHTLVGCLVPPFLLLQSNIWVMKADQCEQGLLQGHLLKLGS